MESKTPPNYIRFNEVNLILTHPTEIPGGTVPAIPSKSHAHRLLIAAALSGSTVHLICPSTSRDIDATADCLRALGADIRRTEDGFLCHGICAGDRRNVQRTHKPEPGITVTENVPPEPEPGITVTENVPPESDSCEKAASVNVGESGSTLRFLLPVLGALGLRAELHMQGRLSLRPLSPLYEEMIRHGVTLSPQGENPLRISGQMTAGIYVIDGGVSSQYITGLLFALPILPEASRLVITGKLESRPYVDITLQVLKQFGIIVHYTEISSDTVSNANSDMISDTVSAEFPEMIHDATLSFDIPGGQSYHCLNSNDAADSPAEPGSGVSSCLVEGDWSNAAFFLTAGALLKNPVTVTGCNLNSAQGDKAILTLLQQFGADVHAKPSGASAGAALADMTSGDTAPADMTSGDTAPAGMTSGDTAPADMTSGDTAPADMTSGDTAPADMTSGDTAPAGMTSADTSDMSPDSNMGADSDAPAVGLSDITVRGGALHGIDIDAADIPDLVPILSVAAAFAEGTTTIRNIDRLRIKESDRVATVLEMLSRLGADAVLAQGPAESVEHLTEAPENEHTGSGKRLNEAPENEHTGSGEYLRITGKPSLPGGTLRSHNDHRIAMASAIAALRCSGPVAIEDPFAVNKSYPGFFEDLLRILQTGS